MTLESGEDAPLLRQPLFVGLVTGIRPNAAEVTLATAIAPSGAQFEARRYGRGEVGELVLVEGQVGLVLGRIVEVLVPSAQRLAVAATRASNLSVDVVGVVQFLGSVDSESLTVTPGVAAYPRLGDRVYSAPHQFVANIPRLMEAANSESPTVMLELGSFGADGSGSVLVRPEKVFGRHCAILGATGGGKSWTVASLVEGCLKHSAKVLLIDATGEYRNNLGPHVRRVRLGQQVYGDEKGSECSIPATSFQESDFVALFAPSPKVQGPMLREAIRTLRVLRAHPQLGCNEHGGFTKANRSRRDFLVAVKSMMEEGTLENPRSPFDVHALAHQVLEECVWPNNRGDAKSFGGYMENERGYCLSLVTRISSIIASDAFAPVFRSSGSSFLDVFRDWLSGESRLLSVSLAGVSYEGMARELLVNALGRSILDHARLNRMGHPLIVIMDEAHNFLGRQIGDDDTAQRLDAFELMAREGRKYGVNLCLATQRPRDLTDGVLSQMGTLIVHRLTNERDREIVERSCGEVDRTASTFLPNLRPGEAVLIGVDFPIPLTMRIKAPRMRPCSDGPDYQKAWASAS